MMVLASIEAAFRVDYLRRCYAKHRDRLSRTFRTLYQQQGGRVSLANTYLETIAGKDFSANDLWSAFVNWMAYFFSDQVMKQEIAEIALRRARLLE